MSNTLHGLYSLKNSLGQNTGSPGDLPNPGIEPRSPALQVDSLPAAPPGKPHCIAQGILLRVTGSLERTGAWGRMDPRICVAESLFCPPEIIPTSLISSILAQNEKFKILFK